MCNKNAPFDWGIFISEGLAGNFPERLMSSLRPI